MALLAHIDGILSKVPYPPCLRMSDRALLAGYPRYMLGCCGIFLKDYLNDFVPALYWVPAEGPDSNLPPSGLNALMVGNNRVTRMRVGGLVLGGRYYGSSSNGRLDGIDYVSDSGFEVIIMMTSSNGNIFRVTGHLCGEFTGGEFPAQRPVTRSFDVFFDLRPNKRLSKQP